LQVLDGIVFIVIISIASVDGNSNHPIPMEMSCMVNCCQPPLQIPSWNELRCADVMSHYHHSSSECLRTPPPIRIIHTLVIESAPHQHRELHTQKTITIELPSPIVDMPPPQGGLLLIVAFMAR
jgi:hypothetical protein